MGLAVAVEGAAVQVVVVVVASGQQQEQVADDEAMGSVQSQFRQWQGLAHLEGGVSGGACVCMEGTARLWLPLSCNGLS